MNSQLTSFLEANDTLVDEQNGFRCSRSCEDHVFVLSSIIDSRKHEGKSIFAAFIDMSKEVDCINHNMLCFKLLKNKINGNFYNAIIALYKETESCVQINNFTTIWFGTLQGEQQGDNLSPTLFNIHLNDLVLYADDIVLISENEQSLQKMLDHVGY